MDHLWRDRMAYILGAAKPPAGVCVFCEAPQQDDAAAYILHRGKLAYVILNIFPYNTGHVMINPYAHVDSIEKLDDAALLEIMQLTGSVWPPSGRCLSRRRLIWARIWAKRRAAASINIFTFTSCRAGRAIPTSCPSWRKRACCRKISIVCTRDCARPSIN